MNTHYIETLISELSIWDASCRRLPNARRSSLLGLSVWSEPVTQREKSMTMTENAVRNGVDTATLFATVDTVKGRPRETKFRFQATNTWGERDPQPVDDPRVPRRDAGHDAP